MSALEFEIPGPFVSGNHAKTRDGRRTTKAREFDEKVRILCAAAVREQKWAQPEYVRVLVSAVNVGIDCDNLAKELLDPMQGRQGAFLHDSRVLALYVSRWKAPGTQRVLVSIEGIDGQEHGFPKPRVHK